MGKYNIPNINLKVFGYYTVVLGNPIYLSFYRKRVKRLNKILFECYEQKKRET